MKLRSIASEAFRSLWSGSSRAAPIVVALALLVLMAVHLVVEPVRTALNQIERNHMSSVYASTISVAGQVSGPRCDNLASESGVEFAGAWRLGETVFLRRLPNAPLQIFEVSPSMLSVMHVGASLDRGVYVSSSLAADLDLRGSDTALTLRDGERIPVTGVFSDAIVPSELHHSIVEIVPAREAFDSCTVNFWPPTRDPDPRLLTTVDGTKIESLQVTQVNSTFGAVRDPVKQVRDNQRERTIEGTGLVAALVGALGVALRRAEFGLAKTYGVRTHHVVTQVTMESFVVGVGALLLVAFPIVYLCTVSRTLAEARFLASLSAQVALSATLSYALGAAAVAASIRQRRVLHYLQNR